MLSTKHFKAQLVSELRWDNPLKCPRCEVFEAKSRSHLFRHLICRHKVLDPLIQAAIVKMRAEGKEPFMAPMKKSSVVFYHCPQKDKHQCSKKFAIRSFQDVVKMCEHLTIPPESIGLQLHNLHLIATERGSKNQCPVSHCKLRLKDDGVTHFINMHHTESMILYLFWDAKDYGDNVPNNFLSALKEVLPSFYKSSLSDYLTFINSNRGVNWPGFDNHKGCEAPNVILVLINMSHKR